MQKENWLATDYQTISDKKRSSNVLNSIITTHKINTPINLDLYDLALTHKAHHGISARSPSWATILQLLYDYPPCDPLSFTAQSTLQYMQLLIPKLDITRSYHAPVTYPVSAAVSISFINTPRSWRHIHQLFQFISFHLLNTQLNLQSTYSILIQTPPILSSTNNSTCSN